ncbi:MAG: tRNA lysidine(34) synthetase TilS [Chloroflexi bacterium]|nr:tRNA lysidine(34) synthetase TilS [Chloroflexota bacterium]
MSERLAERLERRVAAFLLDGPPRLRGATAVVAVSGGPDSVCLLAVVCALAARLDLNVHVGHVHHGLRPAAQQDAAAVTQLAERLGVPATVLRVDARATARARRSGVEEAARTARYQALESLAEHVGAVAVLTGHSADDVAETVLIHLLRGSGPDGLAGMPARRPLSRSSMEAGPGVMLLRPLVSTRRAETVAYCRLRGLPTVEDETNLDPRFLRNRVRHHLLPVLATYNPNVVEALNRLALLAAQDRELVGAIVQDAFARVASVEASSVLFAWEIWLTTPSAVRGRLLRRAVSHLGGSAPPRAAVEGAERLLSQRTSGKQLPLGSGLWLRTLRTGIRVEREGSPVRLTD